MTIAREVQGVSLGPAAVRLLAPGSTFRVHGVSASALHLQPEGTRDFLTLVGRRGGGLPHAVALACEELGPWGVAPGDAARFTDGVLLLTAAGGPVRVELAHARRLPRRTLPAISSPGTARLACARRLAELQAAAGADLRLEVLTGDAAPPSPLAARLAASARALADATADLDALGRAAAALLGVGGGVTPSGDGFLAGYLAAARAAGRPALADALGRAIERGLERTSAPSGFLLRCAIAGEWPGPLVDLAEALAADRQPEALGAVAALCAMDAGAGADLAAGMLFGLR